MSDPGRWAHPNARFLQSGALPENEVGPGDSGDDVERAYAYLWRFGYFPNPSLTRSYPWWRPAVGRSPEDPARYDDQLETAVRVFQRMHHLPETGSVDQSTVELMRQPRCGVPDLVRSEGLGRFVAQGNRWDGPTVTYSHANFSSDLTEVEERQAIRDALDRWSVITPLDFAEDTSADIEIGFFVDDHGDGSNNVFDGLGGVIAHCFSPPSSGSGDGITGDCHFDDAETWSVNTPATGLDLLTVALHELGHGLGLDHSDLKSAVMYTPYQGVRRELTSDDISGIQSIYGTRRTREFDVQFYLATYADLQAAFGTDYQAALDHWTSQGLPNEGRRGSREFDVRFYLATYADLQAAFGTDYQAALDHWTSQGLPNEGRRGSREFDVRFYLATYGDLQAAFGTDYQAALDHWTIFGISEGRRGSREFDVRFYLATYGDLQAAFGTDYQAALDHWTIFGISEGRRGSREFDVRFYLATYADLQAAFGTDYQAALDHWTSQGLPNEGRRGSREFDVRFYLATYADLQAAFGTDYQAALDHWTIFGISEGRAGAP